MAAPIGTVWGPEVNDSTNGFKIGLYVTTAVSDSSVAVEVQVWVATKFWISDSSNTLSFDWGTTDATTSQGSIEVNTEGSSTGWAESRQFLAKTFTKTYDRIGTNQAINVAAKLGGINAVSGTANVTTSFDVPSMEYKVIYDANGGSGAPSSQISTSAFALSTTVPVWEHRVFMGWSTMNLDVTGHYQPGQMWSKVGEYTLYAVWKPFTEYVKENDSWDAGIVWINQNGVWVRGEVWTRENDKWIGKGGQTIDEDPGLRISTTQNSAGGLTYTITTDNYTVTENPTGLTYEIGG